MDFIKSYIESTLFNETTLENEIDKLLEIIKENGVSNGNDLLWYKSFLKVSCLYIIQNCEENDRNFESLLKLCVNTKPHEISNVSVFDIMLQDWMAERVDLVKDYHMACFNGMPENPLSILQSAFEVIYKKNLPDFAKSAAQTYDRMIEHYEIVLSDLSGEIYDAKLEAQKESVIKFLQQMQTQWKDCKESFLNQF